MASASDAYHIGGVNVGTIAELIDMLAGLSNSQHTFLSETETAYVDCSGRQTAEPCATQHAVGIVWALYGVVWDSVHQDQISATGRFVSQTNLAITSRRLLITVLQYG